MWRITWIHPFADGNGRVARMCAFLAACRGFGELVPDFTAQLRSRDEEYFAALESADSAWVLGDQELKPDSVDVHRLRYLLEDILY